MGKVGRRRIYDDEAARMRERRQKAKAEGKKSISVTLEGKHKTMLATLCRDLRISQAEAISYLLECAYDRELPNLLHDSDSTSGTTE